MAAKFAKATVKVQILKCLARWHLKGIYIGAGNQFTGARTALAEAELEYQEHHVSRSIYGLFKIVTAPSTNDGLLEEFPDLCLAIRTTTPCTIPANAAVAVNARLEYAVVEAKLFPEDVPSSAGNEKSRLGNVLKEPKKPSLK
ncbi:Aminoacyl-tRNA synthetase, class Ia [Corchorus olitorius]|uniref:Aminoacyl-tRNA synthetase, class Ia n=1 Tax=Corchorus olitorius TaxID=93759 RepID=A0A1R3GJ88_9ROSI|nr:Aminoacyl-tRNA synthetase, class Ia [Corchorus olitorius]